MLFLQTKFVKCKKIHYKTNFVIFTNFFFKLTNFRLYILKKIGYKIVCKNFFFSVETANRLISYNLFLYLKKMRFSKKHLISKSTHAVFALNAWVVT